MDIHPLNKVIDEGGDESFRKNNKKLLKKTDTAAVDQVVNEQIELLGSELLYQRINNNFLEQKFEAFFAKEQYKLFTWREKFFYSKFKDILTGTRPFEDVPYHITLNFKEVTDYCPDKIFFRDYLKTGVFFENYDKLSYTAQTLVMAGTLRRTTLRGNATAQAMFDPKPLSSRHCSLDKDELEDCGVNFKNVAHMIMALHSIGPCTLLESAMKTVLLHHLPIHDIPKELQQKALHGLYSDDVKYPVPGNLSPLGQRYFRRYRDEFSAASEDASSAASDNESSAVSDDESYAVSDDDFSSVSDDED